jgi:hypothetical protein
MSILDEQLYLQGDEDAGVGIQCRVCDRGGAPVAYYTYPDGQAYEGTDVQVVHTITALFNAGLRHAAVHSSSAGRV